MKNITYIFFLEGDERNFYQKKILLSLIYTNSSFSDFPFVYLLLFVMLQFVVLKKASL